MNPFHELESPIIDASIAAQILATLFEDTQVAAAKHPNGQVVLTEHEAEMLGFMIYDLCRRTHQTRKDFQSACDADHEAKSPVAKAA